MLPYKNGFRVSAGFGFGDGFSPESVFGSGLGFKFGFRFWVPRHSTRPKPDLLPSLFGDQVYNTSGHRVTCASRLKYFLHLLFLRLISCILVRLLPWRVRAGPRLTCHRSPSLENVNGWPICHTLQPCMLFFQHEHLLNARIVLSASGLQFAGYATIPSLCSTVLQMQSTVPPPKLIEKL